jgi:hypothetical protein
MPSFIATMCCSIFYGYPVSEESRIDKKSPYLLVNVAPNIQALLVSDFDPANVKGID